MPSVVSNPSGTSTSSLNPYGGQANAPNAAQAAAAAIAQFLKIAPTKYYTILGQLTGVGTATQGGATANIVWQQPIPIIPSFCTAIDYTIQLPITLSLQATTGTSTASPFAPWSAFSQQMTLGGAPPWPMMELTPWYLDEITNRVDYDPLYPGLGDYGNAAPASWPFNVWDQGPIPANINQLVSGTTFTPGATYTNTTGGTTTTNFSVNFNLRQQLQRKRHLLWGAVPFGDPENRPNNLVQLNPLKGVNPEQSMFISSDVGANTFAYVQTGQTCNVYAKYELRYIDLLPSNLTAVPQPLVNYGLQLTPFSVTGLVAGTIQPITHRTAQIYTDIHHILVNNQVPLRADYFGLWDDQDQQSARWSFDAQANTFTEFFEKTKRTYRRFLQTGVYNLDLDGGLYPEIPSVTPYDGLMSPDASYAASFGVPITPAMTTSIRIPQGTGTTNPYCRVYSFGLVRVPY